MRRVATEAHMSNDDHLWWQKGAIYQIYPRSFQDSSGDGTGDLRGIAEQLDHLCWLGVDAIWLGPIFSSPMADFGYDVADYCGIDPIFGSMADFDRLLEACHRRGLKLLLDLVPNHTSAEHPWFLESRSSRDNPKRDWYLWRDPKPDGGPPNNWLSVFGGSAWELDERTGQYYYHAFLKEQPDLNWRNAAVRQAIYEAMRFWFDKGVDGFRIDVLWHLIKDERLRDNPLNPDYGTGDPPYKRLLPVYSTDQREVHDVAAEMRAVADAYADRVLIGEIYLPVERLVDYYGHDGRGVHLPFNFQLLTQPWNAREIDRAVNEYEAALPDHGWPNWVLGNHDKSRIASRVGRAQARVAAMLLLTLRGTPTIYYGDELGLEDVSIPSDRIRDPQGLRLGEKHSRDPARTPMPWSAERNAGFTAGEPWLPVGPDYRVCNVEAQKNDPDSFLTLYRRLLSIRRERRALAIGRYVPVTAEGDAIAFVREHEDDRLLVALNLGADEQCVAIEAAGEIMLATSRDRERERVRRGLRLGPHDAVLIDLSRGAGGGREP
jgi:alpha-glucosidase